MNASEFRHAVMTLIFIYADYDKVKLEQYDAKDFSSPVAVIATQNLMN